MLLNLSGNVVYEANSRCITATPFHINGLRSKHSYFRQTGNIRVFGVSFYPFGLYPFVNKSLAGIHDRVIDLQELSSTLVQNLKSAFFYETTTESIIERIEKTLHLELRVTKDYMNKAELMHAFLESDSDTTIQSFCSEHDINIKTFQRNVLRYTGYTPKVLRSLKRFQRAGNQTGSSKSKSTG